MRSFWLALGLLVLFAVPARSQTPQIERGKELFVRSPKGQACASCHEMAGLGTPAGPDLRNLASAAVPRGLITAIQMTMTEYVRDVKLKGQPGHFPGMVKMEGDKATVYDLSKNPVVKHEVAKADITEMKRNTTWKHPPTSASYTPQELADLIGFLRFSATGSKAEVKVADIQ